MHTKSFALEFRHMPLLVVLFLGIIFGYTCQPLHAKETQPNDPYYHSKGSWEQNYDDQWALKHIGFTTAGDGKSAWDLATGADYPVVVAVIDTGLDYFHPDFSRENLWRNLKEVPNGKDDDGNGYVDDLIGWNFIDHNNNPWDKAGHGTHTAGVIAAATGNGEGIAGMNHNVKIMPLKVLNFLGRGLSSGIAEAIFYAVDNGAKIINLSLGGEYITKLEKMAVAYADEKGVVVVVASGNTASNTSDYGFAALDSVITVAATGFEDKRAGFSNWGQDVKIAAPGLEILSLRARRTDFVLISGAKNYEAGASVVGSMAKYYRASGTSFAAPFVSGVASLILSKNPTSTAEQVTRMILMSADDIEVPGWDQLTGYGLLNARKALQADPDYYTIAKINKIAPTRKEGKLVIEVYGTAESSEFKEGLVELGFGEKPKKWKKVGKKFKKEVKDSLLAEISPKELTKKGKWSVRVIVKTKKHGKKEGWGNLDIQ